MNLTSTILGVVAIPLSGFIGEILMIPFGTGTFHPTHWLMSYVFAVFSNVLIEGFTVKIIFKHSFKKMFWWLFVANAISVITVYYYRQLSFVHSSSINHFLNSSAESFPSLYAMSFSLDLIFQTSNSVLRSGLRLTLVL